MLEDIHESKAAPKESIFQDHENFYDTVKALKTLQCSDDEINNIWCLLASMVHLSNLIYEDVTNHITSSIDTHTQISSTSSQGTSRAIKHNQDDYIEPLEPVQIQSPTIGNLPSMNDYINNSINIFENL